MYYIQEKNKSISAIKRYINTDKEGIAQCTYCGSEIKFGFVCNCLENAEKYNIFKNEIKGECMDEIDLTESQIAIVQCMNSMREFLLEKNRRYGDSALHPKRMFSKATTDEQILVRLDDKISRIQNSDELRKNDIADMLGYLTLLCVSKRWTDFSDLLD